MVNWAEIHEDFGEKEYPWHNKNYQQLWEKESLTYQDAQEWIAVGFKPKHYDLVKQWKILNITPPQAQQWINLGLKPTDTGYLEWLTITKNLTLSQINQTNEPELKTQYQQELANQKTLQQYLNWKYPALQTKENLKIINISEINLKEKGNMYNDFLQGNSLDLNEFVNLEEVDVCGGCLTTPLTELKVNNCQELVSLNCSDNQLTNLDLTNQQKLEELYINDNNLHQDLAFLSHLVNLKELDLDDNSFYGSLEYLQDLSKLEKLLINNTDIDSGLEYLPESIKEFWCSAYKRKGAKCQAIYNLFAKDLEILEIDGYRENINFSQKLKAHKHKITQLITKHKELIAYLNTPNYDSLKAIELRSELRTLKNETGLTETELTEICQSQQVAQILYPPT